MPYKSKEEYNEYMRARRKPVNPVTPDVNPNPVNPDKPKNVNPDVNPRKPVNHMVNPKMLTRPNRLGANGLPEMIANEYDPTERLPDGRQRYLGPFTDGQVHDRLSVAV